MECLKLKTVQKCYIKALGTEEYAEKMGRKTIAGKKNKVTIPTSYKEGNAIKGPENRQQELGRQIGK